MSSLFTKLITISCPEGLIDGDAASNLLSLINDHLGGANTFPGLGWENKDGERFSVMSFTTREDFNIAPTTIIEVGEFEQITSSNATISVIVGSVGEYSPTLVVHSLGITPINFDL